MTVDVMVERNAGMDAEAPQEMLAAVGAPRSILDAVRSEVAARETASVKTLPVGVIAHLSCRYRPVSDDQRDEIGKRAVSAAGDDVTRAARETCAALLAAACDTLLWDGKPLHEVLNIPGPLRYNAELASLFDLDLGEKPSSVEVVIALHQHGESSAPLETAAEAYGEWLTGKRKSAVEWALGER